MAKIHILTALAIILLSALVQAQWQWGNNGEGSNDDDDDEPPRSSTQWGWGRQTPSPRPQPRPTSQPPRQPLPWEQQPQQSPWNQPPEPKQPQQPRPKQPQQSTWGPGTASPRPVVTVTITRPKNQPTPQPRPPITTPVPNQPFQPQPPPSSSRTWSQPSQWGPPRSPFGPNPTVTGPQTIPTTTTEKPREPVPFLTTCGRTRYIEDDVQNALIAGCYYKNKTTTVNKSEFPKPFANTQGFNFGNVQPPFWEFPLINSAGYVGGPPGPDRVIFNEPCFLAGEITQTNAGARGFTECVEAF